MTECGECGAELDPAWKFCIYCGTRVTSIVATEPSPKSEPELELGLEPESARTPVGDLEAAGAHQPPVPASRSTTQAGTPAVVPAVLPAEPREIPSAIRPQRVTTDVEVQPIPRRPRFDLPLVLGIAIGVFGLVAVVVAFAIIASGG